MATPGIESYNDLKNRAIDLDIFGFRVHVASIDDLIRMKQAANRPKDRNHILELMALKKLIEDEGASR